MPLIPSDPSSLTADWFSEVLKADVQSCKVEQIAVGVGLLGRLFRVHLNGAPDVPATVVVKLPTLDLTARTEICEAGDVYRREVNFYRTIGTDNPLPPARAYHAEFDQNTHDFVLVLEDLARLRTADQTRGCSRTDAETVIDAIALHQAHWWDNDRLAALPWLGRISEPPLSDMVIANYKTAWPIFVERLGSDMTSATRDFGDRFESLMPFFFSELARPPFTFLHGDLRLDQLFFALDDEDPPVTVLDWQISSKGRGAYDVGYFLSQSLTADARRSYEDELLERYAERLAEHGIDYPRDQLRYDYQLTTVWCFVYPVLAAGQIDIANDRQLELVRAMLSGAAAAIEDYSELVLRPD